MADPDPQQPPTPQPAPAPQPAPEPHRRTEADLRAELAAERVSKADMQRTLEARATKAEADLVEARTTGEAKTTTAVDAVTAKLTKMQSRLVEAELKAGAATVGLKDPDLLLHPLLDRTLIKITEDGEVSGVTEAFDTLKVKKPEWFGTATPPPVVPRPATGAPAPAPGPSLGATNVRELSKEDYAERKRALRTQLRGGAR